MRFRSVLTVLAVAVVLCLGYASQATRQTESAGSVPASSCLGHDGVQFSFNACQGIAGTVGTSSCIGDGACSFAGLNGASSIGSGACVGAFACLGAGVGGSSTIGNNSCNGVYACINVGVAGNSSIASGSCLGLYACFGVGADNDKTISDGTCIGPYACDQGSAAPGLPSAQPTPRPVAGSSILGPLVGAVGRPRTPVVQAPAVIAPPIAPVVQPAAITILPPNTGDGGLR